MRRAWGAELDWIHRRDGESDIYFLANLDERPAQGPDKLMAEA